MTELTGDVHRGVWVLDIERRRITMHGGIEERTAKTREQDNDTAKCMCVVLCVRALLDKSARNRHLQPQLHSPSVKLFIVIIIIFDYSDHHIRL